MTLKSEIKKTITEKCKYAAKKVWPIRIEECGMLVPTATYTMLIEVTVVK